MPMHASVTANGLPSTDHSALIPADLEAAADALLETSGFLATRSVFTERQLARKMRLERKRAPLVPEDGLPGEVLEYLAEIQLNDLIEVSNLTQRQELCFRLRVQGFNARRISATLHVTPQSVAVCLRIAKRKVRAAIEEGRYAGWYEVYLSEVNRPVYRPCTREQK